MKRYSLVFSLCVMSYLCMAGVARAQVTLTLVNPPSSIISNNIYVGPYSINITGGGTIQAVCDDYDTHSGFSPWTANVNTFATTLSNAKFFNLPSIHSGTTETQNYEAAAWLTQQMFALSPSTANYNTVIGDIHLAIWSIFSSNAYALLSSNSVANDWYTSGFTHDNDLSSNPSEFSNIIIYTPTISYQNDAQEFMGETPEPASMMLFGTGLLVIGAAIRRRRTR
jgi:hypothetical protein